MTREEHLSFCKKCTNRKFDTNQGIICRLTDKKADFTDECPSFNLDVHVKESDFDPKVEMPSHEFVKQLSEDSREQFRQHQDFSAALIGGVILSFISAFIWAIITVTTQYQIGYMAIGVGLLVGFGIRFFGAGVDQKFGIAGAVLALFGCLLGNFFSQIGFIAQDQGLGYLQALQLFDWAYLPDIYTESFSIMDLLFYGFAIAEGYKFAFRHITPEEVAELRTSKIVPLPLGYQYRKPALIAGFILFGFFLFKFNQGTSGEVTYKYEDGSKMSQGQYEGGKENGAWTYWYPDGTLQAEVSFINGVPDGKWLFYDEMGNKTQEANYKKGLLDGSYLTFYENGVLSLKGAYSNNRETGDWVYYHENGKESLKGNYVHGMQEGLWELYYEDGKTASSGNMSKGLNVGIWKFWAANGQQQSELNYLENDVIETLNSWANDGTPMVTNGNGYIKEFSPDNVLLSEGKVENKRKIGKWTFYYQNGQKMEEGEYTGGEYLVVNSWSPSNDPLVKAKNGIHEKYDTEYLKVVETGAITNGKKEGLWKSYYPETGNLLATITYKNGKQEGEQSAFSESGALITKGEFKNGKQNGEWTWYHEAGTIESVVQWNEGKKVGSQVFYDAEGNKTKEEVYLNGNFQKEILFNN